MIMTFDNNNCQNKRGIYVVCPKDWAWKKGAVLDP